MRCAVTHITTVKTSHTIHELTDADEILWDAFVAICPGATFFHRAGWRKVIQRSFGHRTHFLYAVRGCAIVGILPLVEIKSVLFGHAFISTGFCVHGGPIAIENGARDALNEYAEALFKKSGASYLEYRAPHKPNDTWQTRDDLYANFAGPLPAIEDANLKQIPRKQRAVVRKAMKSKLTWAIEDNVDNLYDLYALSVRNLGTPVFAKRYFANLLAVFKPQCDVLTVFSDGKPVASVLNFYHKGKVMPFYSGSVLSARRSGANDLMYWRLMRHASAKGCTQFDFGRSKVGTGAYYFKKNWGFKPEPIAHQFLMRDNAPLPNINPLNPKYRLMIAVWKKLPLFVANAIGPFVVRNIG